MTTLHERLTAAEEALAAVERFAARAADTLAAHADAIGSLAGSMREAITEVHNLTTLVCLLEEERHAGHVQ